MHIFSTLTFCTEKRHSFMLHLKLVENVKGGLDLKFQSFDLKNSSFIFCRAVSKSTLFCYQFQLVNPIRAYIEADVKSLINKYISYLSILT